MLLDAPRMTQVATAVGEAAFQDGMAQIEKPENLENYMADRMWCVAAAAAAAPVPRLLLRMTQSVDGVCPTVCCRNTYE